MTAFLIGATLLMATALAFLLMPLLRKERVTTEHVQRDQLNLAVLRDQLRELDADLEGGLIEPLAYESARHELERRVAEEVKPDTSVHTSGASMRWSAVAVAIVVPVLAVGIYMAIGNPAGLNPANLVAADDSSHQLTPEQIEGMVAKLADRLKNDPNNAEGWNMLARTYAAMGRYPESAKAYEHLVKLAPNDASVLTDYADALAMANDRSLQGEPEKLIKQALTIDPKNVKALALAGSAAFDRKDYAHAAEYWQKILDVVPRDSEVARSVLGSINEAKGLMGEPQLVLPPAAQSGAGQAAQAPQAASGMKVEGTVDIDPALRAKASDSDAVFIFARAAEGPRFPLAVVRAQVKDLPFKFVLDDSMSMTPEARLSNYPRVVVSARVSKSGSATPAPGDLEGSSDPVAPGATGLKVRINSTHK
ncbi:MAG TPA: c-type cytochrome biogenesis protein CcmI [Noviherbaspirillum sp.]|uniref:c-type cytochrome biogenesis protein CcmI n=1 Tax=Noviherbaspirillum sp. TaxID=1926288 RepID=UPI002B470C49|nr:c-type cytochrome biogenesis protein CcmI [Noviherbaspirillum sp.]HJV88635.1 c-type cytochrome biogenesis protein CcmI [Noviherbaspirillum sp.]